MILRLAHGYVRLLLALEVLLLIASFLLHVSGIFMGSSAPYDEYAVILFRAAVIVGIPTVAFVKDSFGWLDQIKSCPRWMWRVSLVIGVYSLLTAFFPVRVLTASGFPLGFEAIPICILYSVLSKDYLERTELVKRTLHSVVIIGLGTVVLLAFRAGYLPSRLS